MTKNLRWNVALCLLSAISVILGQATKNIFIYAPIIGFFSGFILIALAAVLTLKKFDKV